MRQDKAEKYYELATSFANIFSKDPATKVGTIILAPDSYQVLTMGYNGMPRGIDETIEERWDRPQKYSWVEHAERNAIANASRHGTPLKDSIAIITMFPCAECTRMLIQSGVQTVVTKKPDFSSRNWGLSFQYSITMLQEAKINIIYIENSPFLFPVSSESSSTN
jgi:dCMP deaminase